MSDHVYAISEIVGSSSEGIEDALENALARAQDNPQPRLVRGDVDTRAFGRRGRVAHHQVTLKLGFRMEG